MVAESSRSRLDEILGRLLEIRAQRLDPATSESVLLQLEEERRRLRTEARRLGDGGDETRQAQIAFMERRISQIESAHVTGSTAAQTGFGGGIDPRYVHQLNAKIDEATGLDELKARLRDLTSYPPP